MAPNGDGLTETIELRCLDQFGFSRIDLLKIDAEGMEADVILGGLLTLKNTRPIVFAECNDLRQGSRTWQALADLDYRIHGVISPAFDPVNFRGEHHNIFGEAAEVSLLGVPSCRLEQVASSFELNNLALIDSLDALALLLLHKPQYPEEALSGSGAAAVLGLNFKTPLSRGLQIAVNNATAELSDQSTVLAEHAKALAEQASVLAEQAQKIKTLELQLGESLESNIRLIEQNRSLERYRGTSLLNAWEQVRRISR